MKVKMITDCSAAILAGGKNSRYGGFHKAFLRIDNKLIIEHHIELLSELFEDVFIISNDLDLFSQFGLPVYTDIYQNRGPLAGIQSALFNTNNEAVMVFGCDMPYLEEILIQRLYSCWKNSGKLFCVPKSNGHLEPLHALYSKETLKSITDWLENKKGNAIYKYLESQDVQCLEKEINEAIFININSPEDIRLMGNG